MFFFARPGRSMHGPGLFEFIVTHHAENTHHHHSFHEGVRALVRECVSAQEFATWHDNVMTLQTMLLPGRGRLNIRV